MRPMVFSPHADDGELAMGGTMARFVREESWVGHVLLSSDDYVDTRGKLVNGAIREREFAESCNMLGTESIIHRIFTDNRFDAIPQSVAVNSIEGLLREFLPTEVYVPWPWFNRDHTVVWEVMQAVLRPSQTTHKVQALYAYEMPAQERSVVPPPRTGSRYVKLDRTDIERKYRALECFKTQMVNTPNRIVGIDGVKALMRLRGLEAGLDWAERQFLIWSSY